MGVQLKKRVCAALPLECIRRNRLQYGLNYHRSALERPQHGPWIYECREISIEKRTTVATWVLVRCNATLKSTCKYEPTSHINDMLLRRHVYCWHICRKENATTILHANKRWKLSTAIHLHNTSNGRRQISSFSLDLRQICRKEKANLFFGSPQW